MGAHEQMKSKAGTGMGSRSVSMALGIGVLLAVLPAMARIGDNVVHPAYEMKTIPMPALYISMGLGFLPDGRMVLATGYTEDGRTDPGDESNIWAVSGVTGTDMGNIKMTKLGTRFINPSGVIIVDGKIYVADRDAFYEILDNNATGGTGNRKKIVTWPFPPLWHQWVFTPMYWQGKFYAPYSGSIKGGGPSDVPASSPYSGAFLKWDLAGNFEKFAGGLRSPNGANIDANGDMFVSDNQGSWLPSSTFSHMKQGKFYGHRQSPKRDDQGKITETFAPNWAESLPYQPPTAWFPHGVVRSSPGQPIYIPKGAYAGQWLQGDCNGTGLLRISLDKVNGDYQGAVFWFTNGTTTSAINRMAWGPDDALYIATVEHMGNWPGNGAMPMYKLVPKAGGKAFEMLSIRSVKDGFHVEFTEPLDKTSVTAAAFGIKQWQYVRQEGYGDGKGPEETRTVSSAQVSADGKTAILQVTGLKTDRVTYFKLNGVKSAAGAAPFDNEAWYTLNNMNPNSTPTALTPREDHARGPRAMRMTIGLDGANRLHLPEGVKRVEVFALDGRKAFTIDNVAGLPFLELPSGMVHGIYQVRMTR